MVNVARLVGDAGADVLGFQAGEVGKGADNSLARFPREGSEPSYG